MPEGLNSDRRHTTAPNCPANWVIIRGLDWGCCWLDWTVEGCDIDAPRPGLGINSCSRAWDFFIYLNFLDTNQPGHNQQELLKRFLFLFSGLSQPVDENFINAFVFIQ
jgi:hypothetical protein